MKVSRIRELLNIASYLDTVQRISVRIKSWQGRLFLLVKCTTKFGKASNKVFFHIIIPTEVSQEDSDSESVKTFKNVSQNTLQTDPFLNISLLPIAEFVVQTNKTCGQSHEHDHSHMQWNHITTGLWQCTFMATYNIGRSTIIAGRSI